MIEGYPLQWPVGWVRTPAGERSHSRYQVSATIAINEMLEELRLMGIDRGDVVISTNVPQRRDGLPRASAAEPDDPGAAVYWTRHGRPQVIACDCWMSLRENLRAVGLAIAGLRAIERCGASQLIERAYEGFKALPASSTRVSWWVTLGISIEDLGEISESVVKHIYRARSRRCHPDIAGDDSTVQMAELNRAYEEAVIFLQNRNKRKAVR